MWQLFASLHTGQCLSYLVTSKRASRRSPASTSNQYEQAEDCVTVDIGNALHTANAHALQALRSFWAVGAGHGFSLVS